MLQYHVAFHLPQGLDRMVVAEVLDFPGVFSQGFDLPDARTMVASALEDMAESYLEEGRALPTRSATATDPEADYVDLIPLSVAAGATRSSPLRPTLTGLLCLPPAFTFFRRSGRAGRRARPRRVRR